MRALVTGGAGFIGHHLVEHLLKNTDWEVILLDRLDFSGNQNRLHEVLELHKDWRTRCRWVFHDLKAPLNLQVMNQIGKVDYVFHLAASTHVDRSIDYPMEFVMDNVVGTTNLLDYCRKTQPREKIIYFSTDEVFGPAAEKGLGPKHIVDRTYPDKHETYHEWDRYRSANPYAASKAGGEEMCLAYENTYKLPILITHCMNVFGERQSPEKYIPMTVKKALGGETVIVHADKTRTKAGSRFYIHARNVADAILTVVDKGVPGDKYNIVGEKEMDNLELAKLIAGYVGKPLIYEMVDFHSSRPGHDLRYALDGTKLAMMGWKPPVTFEQSMERVVKWTLAHPRWLL